MGQHVVVIGAGVYGAAVAAGLTRRGAVVTVVDARVPASGTSGATFSWINSCGKQPRSYHDLNVAGMRAHRDLATAVPGSDWYHETGNLEWAGDDTAQRELRSKVAGLLAYGYEARWLSRAEALRLEPGLDPRQLPDEIAWFPREGWLDPARLVGYLLSVSGNANLIRDDAVTGLEVSGERVCAVLLASGERVSADAVVNCAGPRAATIAEFAGLTLPMRNTRGAVIYVSSTPVSRVIHSPRIHLRPASGGRALLHSEEIDDAADAAGDVPPGMVDALLEAGLELYPGRRDVSADSVRIGERPIPGDGLPVLGRAAELPNFHFAVSHSGATLCLHAGDVVAAETLGEDQGDALAPFRFERF